MKKIEYFIELLIFRSRWLLAPFYLGLVFALTLMAIRFIKELIQFSLAVFKITSEEVIVNLLSLIDIVMVANLLIIIVFAGYENFVSRIDVAAESEDRPSWMGHLGFAELKMKLFGSIVAISGIELLRAFMNISSIPNQQLAWKVGIHLTFVISGVLFAIMDSISKGKSSEH